MIWKLLLLLVLLAAMWLGDPASAQTLSSANVVPLRVRTPHSGFNRLVVSITLCEPGTDRCATVDDIMVDTGSTGLRLEASALPSEFRLPPFLGPDGKSLAECLRFVHDDAWGPLFRADLRIGGMTVPGLPIQIIADDPRPCPDGCPISTAKPTSNGTLGIGPHLLDCQGDCLQDPSRPGVFEQEGGSWRPIRGSVPAASRLPNPISLFPNHRNGVVFDLPAVPARDTNEIVGTLTFGVGDAANNGIGDARIVRMDENGLFTTLYGTAAFAASYIDSGTETYILADDHLPRCAGMSWAFCVSPERTFAATMVGFDGMHVPITFKVGDYRSALDHHVGAWDGFAEAANALSQAFVWGAPLFLGRRIALVFDGMEVDGLKRTQGPLYAFP
ncbi:DUF3443 family protein [Lichenifustis flavocetrariae]|uniref:DUF3443 domain-containing protein n=1 Tax=Lichenifustis flavocetrariae TaxID=2949735 RepID=A0AA42CHD8_9HYPH|nr:DUF3443 family protein [Lichenifustis flavocetrariae]MCW6507443.1 DUF3443 domain-containing protein [Lichenifustis flavocetrariae]